MRMALMCWCGIIIFKTENTKSREDHCVGHTTTGAKWREGTVVKLDHRSKILWKNIGPAWGGLEGLPPSHRRAGEKGLGWGTGPHSLCFSLCRYLIVVSMFDTTSNNNPLFRERFCICLDFRTSLLRLGYNPVRMLLFYKFSLIWRNRTCSWSWWGIRRWT